MDAAALPGCASDYRERVHPHEIVERIARFLGWHIDLCRDCGRRFYGWACRSLAANARAAHERTSRFAGADSRTRGRLDLRSYGPPGLLLLA